MQKASLVALSRVELATAIGARSGHSARTVYGGHEHILRQTVIALRAGAIMGEHENPGEATVQVLQGRIVLAAGPNSWTCWTGDLIITPEVRHSVTALEDSVVLLSVVKLP